jgi:hypothetical protein
MADQVIIIYTNEINGQQIQEIFVPSLELIANFSFFPNSTKVKNINMKPAKCAEYFAKIAPDRHKPILDHKQINVSKEFIDSLRDIKNYEQRLKQTKIDLCQSKDFKTHFYNNQQ